MMMMMMMMMTTTTMKEQSSAFRVFSVNLLSIIHLIKNMGCSKSARFKVRALSSPTTLLSHGGHLSDIVFHN